MVIKVCGTTGKSKDMKVLIIDRRESEFCNAIWRVPRRGTFLEIIILGFPNSYAGYVDPFFT